MQPKPPPQQIKNQTKILINAIKVQSNSNARKGGGAIGEKLVTNSEMIVFGFFIYSGIIIKSQNTPRPNLSHNTCHQLSEKTYINKTPNQKPHCSTPILQSILHDCLIKVIFSFAWLQSPNIVSLSAFEGLTHCCQQLAQIWLTLFSLKINHAC